MRHISTWNYTFNISYNKSNPTVLHQDSEENYVQHQETFTFTLHFHFLTNTQYLVLFNYNIDEKVIPLILWLINQPRITFPSVL